MISAAQFRKDLPEFADETAYPCPWVDYWLNVAGLMLNTCRWGTSAADPWPTSNPPKLKLYDIGIELFVAHNLVLEQRSVEVSVNGGAPGMSSGPINNKSVDKVSVGYDTAAGIETDGGHWNLTIYGTRLLRLMKQLGAGPVQFGIGPMPADGIGSSAAWRGPFFPGGF